MTEEVWQNIEGYEGIYRISNFGRVLSVGRVIYFAKVSKLQSYDRIRKPTLAGAGYHALCLCKNGVNKRQYVHRLVAMAFIPNPNNYKTVNHKNGIKTDNRAENLEWLSQSDNHRHAYSIGLKTPKRNGEAIKLWIKNNPEKKKAATAKQRLSLIRTNADRRAENPNYQSEISKLGWTRKRERQALKAS